MYKPIPEHVDALLYSTILYRDKIICVLRCTTYKLNIIVINSTRLSQGTTGFLKYLDEVYLPTKTLFNGEYNFMKCILKENRYYMGGEGKQYG